MPAAFVLVYPWALRRPQRVTSSITVHRIKHVEVQSHCICYHTLLFISFNLWSRADRTDVNLSFSLSLSPSISHTPKHTPGLKTSLPTAVQRLTSTARVLCSTVMAQGLSQRRDQPRSGPPNSRDLPRGVTSMSTSNTCAATRTWGLVEGI
jgi:hypothetical protein